MSCATKVGMWVVLLAATAALVGGKRASQVWGPQRDLRKERVSFGRVRLFPRPRDNMPWIWTFLAVLTTVIWFLACILACLEWRVENSMVAYVEEEVEKARKKEEERKSPKPLEPVRSRRLGLPAKELSEERHQPQPQPQPKPKPKPPAAAPSSLSAREAGPASPPPAPAKGAPKAMGVLPKLGPAVMRSVSLPLDAAPAPVPEPDARTMASAELSSGARDSAAEAEAGGAGERNPDASTDPDATTSTQVTQAPDRSLASSLAPDARSLAASLPHSKSL